MKFSEFLKQAKPMIDERIQIEGSDPGSTDDSDIVVRLKGDAGENGPEFEIESVQDVRGVVVINVSSSNPTVV